MGNSKPAEASLSVSDRIEIMRQAVYQARTEGPDSDVLKIYRDMIRAITRKGAV